MQSIQNPKKNSVLGAAAGIAAMAFALFLLPAQARAAASEESEANRTLIRSSFDAWRDGTGSPFDLLADDARWTIEGRSVASRTYPSREAFLRDVIRPFNARMRTGLRPQIRSLHADGATVIVHFDARGIALDGRPYVNTYAWFLDMRDGRIVRASAFFDAIEFNELWSRITPR